MSKVKIQGHASGTGVLTVTAPNTSTDRTITLPDGTGTLIADDGSGKVGIGTASPSQKLTISGGSVVIDDGEGYRFGNGDYRIEGKDDGANARIGFVTNNSEIARFTADGLTFNGDTAAANALDDYEEGSFTPTLYGTLTAGSPTYTHQLGYYTKVGNLVHCIIRIYTTSIGTLNGQVRVGALPYTSINTSDTFSSVTCGYGAGLSMTAGNPMTGWIPNNSTYIRLTKWTSAAGTDYIDDAEWSGTGNVMISFTYQTA